MPMRDASFESINDAYLQAVCRTDRAPAQRSADDTDCSPHVFHKQIPHDAFGASMYVRAPHAPS